MDRITALIEAKNALSLEFLNSDRARAVIDAFRESETTVESAAVNVHAVGVGRKIVAGIPTETLCIRFYVIKKFPDSIIALNDRLPTEVNGLPTDVIEAPLATAFAVASAAPVVTAVTDPVCTSRRRVRQELVIAGISASHGDTNPGTIACFCRSTRAEDDPHDVFVLSCNHVFANLNLAQRGDSLFQPALGEGLPPRKFAELHRFKQIAMGGTTRNRTDAAIGKLSAGIGFDPQICTLGNINGVAAPAMGLVRKHGRSSGARPGRIDDVSLNPVVHYGGSIFASFENQIRVINVSGFEPFAIAGDSGSLVVTEASNAAVGLYHAGPANSDDYGIVCPIHDVICELEISLL